MASQDVVLDIHNEADTKDLNGVKDMYLSDIPEPDVILIGAGLNAFTLLNRSVCSLLVSK